MPNRRYRQLATVLLTLGCALVCGAQAQNNPSSPDPAPASPPQSALLTAQTGPKLLANYVETGAEYQTLSNGFGTWAGGYARSVLSQGKNVWNGEINGQREFGDAGVYLAAGDTYTFNPDWYGALTVGSSAGGFFWPRFRTDGFINKKWMGRKQLITTVGYGYVAAKDPHRSHDFFLGSTYYFEKPWIVESGVYLNITNPGTVFAPAGFVAVTQGRDKHHYLTVRSGFGEEAYQLIGPAAALADFNSQTLTITWRKWVGTNWGFNLVGDYYRNPYYTRGGTNIGFFREF